MQEGNGCILTRVEISSPPPHHRHVHACCRVTKIEQREGEKVWLLRFRECKAKTLSALQLSYHRPDGGMGQYRGIYKYRGEAKVRMPLPRLIFYTWSSATLPVRLLLLHRTAGPLLNNTCMPSYLFRPWERVHTIIGGERGERKPSEQTKLLVSSTPC